MSIVEVTVNNFQPDSMEEIEAKLSNLLIFGERIMATLQEVKDAVAAEAAEVKAKVDGLEAEIQGLKDVIAGGGSVTATELDDLLVAVQNIFTPVAVA